MEYLVTPDFPLNINGKEYILDGSFKTLKHIQHVRKQDILVTIEQLSSVNFEECAKIIEAAIIIPPKLETIEQWIVDEVGIANIRNILQAWLLVITRPKPEREDKQKLVGEILEGLGLAPLINTLRGNNSRK